MFSQLVYLFLLTCVASQVVVFPLTSYTGDRYFSTSNDTSVYFSFNAQPCSNESCQAGTCSHLYCATDASGACIPGVDFRINVHTQATINILCCDDQNDCGKGEMCGGSLSFYGSKSGIDLVGPHGKCHHLPSTSAIWMITAIASSEALQAICGTKPKWTPVVGSDLSECGISTTSVQLSIAESNNNVDPLYFNISVGFGDVTVVDPHVGPSTNAMTSPYVAACPGDCVCGGVRQGVCNSVGGITQCQCNPGWHGADCCSSGSLISPTNNSGLSGRAIVGICIGSVVGALLLIGLAGYGIRRMYYRSNNPMVNL